MSTLLLVAEQFQGKLRKVTMNAIGFGKAAAEAWGLDLHLLLIGEDIGDAAAELAKFGAAKVHVADSSDLEHYNTEAHTQLIAKVAEDIDAKVIAGAATVQGKDLFPRVAGRMGLGMASDIIDYTPEMTFKRPVWAGALIAHVQVETDRKVVTVRGTSFDAAAPGDEESEIVEVDVELDEDAVEKFRHSDLEEVVSERPELTEAGTVVSGGRAMKDAAGVELIEGLADAFGAAMGASRAACDAGLVPNELQVGQTGKVVAPDLYIAVGISGAIQHLAGMKGSKVIVAVNKDPEAPIFQLADYGLVADLFKVVPEMTEKVEKMRKG